jgi:hypothetical protein
VDAHGAGCSSFAAKAVADRAPVAITSRRSDMAAIEVPETDEFEGPDGDEWFAH